MSIDKDIELLSALADRPSDVIYDEGTVLLRRHGEEFELSLREVTGIGLAIVTGDNEYEPVEAFCQKTFLGLQSIARNITERLEAEKKSRPGGFVEVEARLAHDETQENWEKASENFGGFLLTSKFGSTTLVELTARAGQGKTVLLSELALKFARQFSPTQSPVPILLPVDLLGRFVGSIDDAIAGELANRYLCPRLTQRDVIECLKRRWLILALDGFDELASRIGVREAFLRIGELGEQLEGKGTVIIAARDSFFEQFQVETAMAKYLQPRKGSYSRAFVELRPWSEKQGWSVFRSLGTEEPEAELKALVNTFRGDRELVFHPFFLTRLAALWKQGERFEEAGVPGSLARTKYIVEKFIERESTEKWFHPGGGGLILKKEEHAYPLGAVAEEMWVTAVIYLDEEEIRLAGELGLGELEIPRTVSKSVLERLPTHCAFIVGRETTSRRYGFIHQRFFHYFLAHRLSRLLLNARTGDLQRVFAAAEIDPEVVRWTAWFLEAKAERQEDIVKTMTQHVIPGADEQVKQNAGSIVAAMVDKGRIRGLEIKHLIFFGEALERVQLHGITFTDCHFWNISIQGSRFDNCDFRRCQFGDIKVDKMTRLAGSTLQSCEVASVRGGRWGSVFSPKDIQKALTAHGAVVKRIEDKGRRNQSGVSSEFTECLEKMVKRSIKSTDQERQELESQLGRIAKPVIRIGLQSGVLSHVQQQFAGRGKFFVRFQVDRELLLKGQVEKTGTVPIDHFWEIARERHAT